MRMMQIILFLALLILLSSFVSAVTTRTASTDTSCTVTYGLKNCTKTLYSGTMNYLEDSIYVPIETNIVNSSGDFDYEVTTGLYSVFFKDDPTQGQVVKYVKDDVEITFQPMALNYRNDISQIQQISMINPVTGTANENDFLYEDAYGSGIDLKYTYYHTALKEGLILDTFSVLPAPEQYILDGGNPTVDLDFVLGTNAQHIVIDGFDWDKTTTTQTQNEVYIKDNDGNILYYLSKPYAYDNNSESSLLTYEFKKSGPKLYVILKTNYTWLQSAVYPVVIDPTVKLQEADSENLRDTDVQQGLRIQNYGANTFLALKESTSSEEESARIYIMFNISSLPSNIFITNSLLYLFYNNDESVMQTVSIYHVYNWTGLTESTITWNNQPCGTAFNDDSNCNLTAEKTAVSLSVGWNAWTAKTAIKHEINNNNPNVSFALKTPEIVSRTERRFRSKEYTASEFRPYLSITYTYNIPKVTLSTPLNDSTVTFGNRPFNFQFTINDSTFDILNATLWWNVSNIWQQNITNQTSFTFGDDIDTNLWANLSRGYYAWNIKVCNVNEDCSFSDVNFTIQIDNTLPTVASATINNSNPATTDDLQCNNGTTSDEDGDVVTPMYNWTKDGVDQSISIKKLDNSLTTVGEIWLCRITPFDGFENGTTKTSATVSIGTGNIPPIINETNSTPLTAELLKGEWLNLSINFTDTNEDPIEKHTAYFCKTDSITTDGCNDGTWCSSPANFTGNYTSCRLNITNSSDFSLQEYTFYTFVVDNTSLISSSVSNIFTIQDITPPTLQSTFIQFSNLNDGSGNTNEFNISVNDNVSNVNAISFIINGTLNLSIDFTFTANLTVNTSYKLFETFEALNRGFYNITRVTVTDNSSNSRDFNFTNITFTVSEEPSVPTPPSGGGGRIAPAKIVEVEIEVPVERCGNFVCEECDIDDLDCISETPLNCPVDCRFFSFDDMFCTPIFNCGNWKHAWFINTMIIFVIIGMVYMSYKGRKVKRL